MKDTEQEKKQQQNLRNLPDKLQVCKFGSFVTGNINFQINKEYNSFNTSKLSLFLWKRKSKLALFK